MTLYYYKAIDEHGRRVSGEMQADDAASAIAELRGSGRLPISAEPASDRRYFGRLFLRLRSWRSRIRGRDITAITHELATLLNAGIPLDGSLRILERYAQNGMLKIVLSEIHNAVQSGKSLSAAMGMHDTVFDPFSVSLIRAGEASGALAAAVERLADHRERTDEFRANLVSSLTYPIVLVCVSVISLFVLLTFVIPRFIPLFADADAPLPLLTQVVFGAAKLMQAYWWVAIFLAAIVKTAIGRWLAIGDNHRKFDAWTLRLPVAGEVILLSQTVRFARTLQTLLQNGMALLPSLKLVRDALGNRAIAAAVDDAATTVRSGGRLSEAFGRTGVLPALAVELMTIGEESGQLEGMLDKAADTFTARVQQRLQRLLTLLEPALILGLGALIALVIVSILLAMLELNELVA